MNIRWYKRLIKLSQPIDYYIWKYPKIVKDAFEHTNKQYENMYLDIQRAVQVHNEGVYEYQAYLHLKSLGVVSSVKQYCEGNYNGNTEHTK